MSTLTDRYISAVVRLLPEPQRADVVLELRELIGELTDAHLRSGGEHPPGATAEEAERAALVELGDPNQMAARYVERPRALVGHELFPEYARTLKVVAGVVVPSLAALALFGAVVDDDRSIVGVVGAPIWAGYQGVVQVAFWVTLVYAFAHRWKGTTPWSPDDLPEFTDVSVTSPGEGRGPSRSDIVFGIAVTVLAGVLLVWQDVAPFARIDGVRIPALHPDIWNGAAQAWLVALAASLIVQVAVLVKRRWTYPLATVNAAVNTISLAILAWLAFNETLINPDLLTWFADRADLDSTPSLSPWIPLLVIGAIELWDTALAFGHAARNPRTA